MSEVIRVAHHPSPGVPPGRPPVTARPGAPPRTAAGDRPPRHTVEEAAVKIVRDFERKLAAAALARDPELSRIYDTRQLTLDLDELDELDDPAQTTAIRTVPEPAGPPRTRPQAPGRPVRTGPAAAAPTARAGGGSGSTRSAAVPACWC